jgi:ribosomal protein S18 acetylase RimI-like enzyme
MIESISKENIDEALPLIRSYQEFYKVANICDEKNKSFFSQFGESSPLGCQFLYREGSEAVGFASVYFTYASTITAKVGVLNDLYTSPNHRGKSIGKQLVEHCHNYAAKNGSARLQWVTAQDNEQAQKLYDSINTKKSTWHFYAYNT